MATVDRVWMRRDGRVFEVRGAPLRSFEVHAGPAAGAATLVLPIGRDATPRALLDIESADEFRAFVLGAMREATGPAKRFFTGAFELRIEGGEPALPAAKGKRMVSFRRGEARIFHAWCDEGILHTVWTPVEMQRAFLLMADELGRVA